MIFTQREYQNFIQRAQHLMSNNAQRIGGVNAAKLRYEQRGPLKARQTRERVQSLQPANERNIHPKRMMKNVSLDVESGWKSLNQ